MTVTISTAEIANYIGYDAPPTEWHHVTQSQIDQFADCTLDHQFIHVNPELAAQTPLGCTIAHGFLTLSMLSHFALSFSIVIEGISMALNSGFDRVRFVNPVKVGSKIRALSRVVDIQERKPGQFRIKTEVTVEIEGEDKPALVAEWIGVQMLG